MGLPGVDARKWGGELGGVRSLRKRAGAKSLESVHQGQKVIETRRTVQGLTEYHKIYCSSYPLKERLKELETLRALTRGRRSFAENNLCGGKRKKKGNYPIGKNLLRIEERPEG